MMGQTQSNHNINSQIKIIKGKRGESNDEMRQGDSKVLGPKQENLRHKKKDKMMINNEKECFRCRRPFCQSRIPYTLCSMQHRVCLSCLYEYGKQGDLRECNWCKNLILYEQMMQLRGYLVEEGFISNLTEQIEDDVCDGQIPNGLGLRQTYMGAEHYQYLKLKRDRNIFREGLKSLSFRYILSDKIPFRNIDILNLSDCNLTFIPDLSDFISLQVLCLQKNKIQRIDTIRELKHLRDINLSENKIKKLQNLFLQGVTILNLSDNKLVRIDNLRQIKMEQMQSLTHLILTNNPLEPMFIRYLNTCQASIKIQF